jgi:hypothetical protein
MPADHRPDALRVRVRPVTRTDARDASPVIDAGEHHTAVPVRQTHDGIDEHIIGERSAPLTDELGGELFAALDEAAKIGVGEHDETAGGGGNAVRRNAGRVGKLPGRPERSS